MCFGKFAVKSKQYLNGSKFVFAFSDFAEPPEVMPRLF